MLGFELRGERFNEAADLPWVHLIHPISGASLGLVEHPTNPGERFDERRCGLGHLSFALASRADLEAFMRRLAQLGVQAPPMIDTDAGSVIVLRDPHNIRIELCVWRGPVG